MTTEAAAGAMSDERLAEIRRNLLEKGWRPTRDETAALFDYIDWLRSAADGAPREALNAIATACSVCDDVREHSNDVREH